MALRHENVFYKHILQGFLARLICQQGSDTHWHGLAFPEFYMHS